jgi:hypothetical protein
MRAPLQARNDMNAVQTATARTPDQGHVDNRPAAVVQRQLVELLNNSPRVLQQRALSDAMQPSTPAVAPVQCAAKPNHTGLPDQLKSRIESLSGMSLDHVKVRYNSDKPARLQAHAYAQGNEIHLGAGQEKHLPHEAWHVVQQAQGRVRPTVQMKGDAVNDDPSLEKEADMMGAQAARIGNDHGGRNLAPAQRAAVVPSATTQVVQRAVTQVWGRWRSDFEPTRNFASREDAEQWDAKRQQEVDAEEPTEAENDATYEWKITVSARNHFGDGWGRQYGITTRNALEASVLAEFDPNEATFEQPHEIYLGDFSIATGNVMGCNILYYNTWVGNHCTTTVFHCGPTNGAG